MIRPMLKKAEREATLLRQKRKPLLKAYDAYKASVAYGDREEDGETHAKILAWHKAILDLEAEAIENCPAEVAYYL